MSYMTLTNTTRVAANYGTVNPGTFTGTPNTTTYDAIVARESAGLDWRSRRTRAVTTRRSRPSSQRTRKHRTRGDGRRRDDL